MTDIIEYGKEQSIIYENTIFCLRLKIQKLKLKLEREEHNDIKIRIERQIKDCRNAIKHNEGTLKRIYLQVSALLENS